MDKLKLDTYEKQADFLNSITAFGKPIMKVTPEYLAMEDEKSGFQSNHMIGMIGNIDKLTKICDETTDETTLYVPLNFWFSRHDGLALPKLFESATERN